MKWQEMILLIGLTVFFVNLPLINDYFFDKKIKKSLEKNTFLDNQIKKTFCAEKWHNHFTKNYIIKIGGLLLFISFFLVILLITNHEIKKCEEIQKEEKSE